MITKEEFEILAHTSRTGRYVSDHRGALVTLTDAGFLRDYGPQRLADGDHYYETTPSGRAALAEWKAAQPKPPAVQKRTQQRRERYRRFRSCADATGCSFRDFLTLETFKYARAGL